MTRLDCLVVGYNEGSFEEYRAVCERTRPGSPERQIYSRERLRVDGRDMPWLEAFSMLRAGVTGRPDRYHPSEVLNLACLYLTSYLRRHGFGAEAVFSVTGQHDELVAALATKPRVVAITTTFYVSASPVLPIVELVRELSPHSLIVVGGPLVDNLAQDRVLLNVADEDLNDLFDIMGADAYVWESQGEAALADICAAATAGCALDSVPNLFLRKDSRGTWSLTSRAPEANNLDECAINWSGFRDVRLGTTVQLRTARSCAFRCTFCDYPSRAGALTLAGVDTVRHELRQLAELGVRNVVFVDDTFNVPPKRFAQLCRMMLEEDLGLSWYSYLRCASTRDESVFDLAAASGCAGVFLGIESADPTVLANMKKLAQDDQYRAGLRELNQRDILTFASIIVGFPGETDKSVRRTRDFLEETRPTFWRAQSWWANPRSPIYRQREQFGIEGRAYNWRHETMTSEEAAAHCDALFDEVEATTWLPLYDFDFWSIPYLRGKGLTVPALAECLRRSQAVMRTESSSADVHAAATRSFEDYVRGLPGLDPARFRLRAAVTGASA
ncbi:PhpK family radical SAM P-methyltransferase [Amycolatopsis saalfeldensis]|uniref:Radical SAM P-methyltransferase, PhpK family n=1 Tax=Amycolatopsis saalfeldensis TaxID=394193 RepID=A0A1H8Y8I9_9PSEU|nr:PhpK family radical SAM P-methyltransferase [Amycolatopsis saalfeldensis]SEP48386.1 radical SAM P-methyltransferase, PhpK family [Amycolatopsis saalfeldensis]